MPAYYNNNLTANPRSLLRTTFIIHIALLVGQVLFAAVTLLITDHSNMPANNIFDLVMPVMTVFCVAASIFLYRTQLQTAAAKQMVMQKMAVYQSAVIIRDALLEGASLFGVVCFMLTGKLLFLLISGVIMIYFASLMPTRDKLLTALNMTDADLDGGEPAKF